MTYIEEDRSILAGGEQGIMMLQIDNKLYHFPNKTVEFDVAPTLVGSRTLVPIRVITEAMGHEVDYDEGTRTVIITTKTEAPAEVEAPVDPVVTDDAETDAAQAE